MSVADNRTTPPEENCRGTSFRNVTGNDGKIDGCWKVVGKSLNPNCWRLLQAARSWWGQMANEPPAHIVLSEIPVDPITLLDLRLLSSLLVPPMARLSEIRSSFARY